MTFRCRLDAEAVADLDRILAWYDRFGVGAGRRFAEDLTRTIDRIGLFPNAYVRVYKSVRRAQIGRFPYFVAYELCVNEFVILGLFAEAQDPVRVIERVGEA